MDLCKSSLRVHELICHLCRSLHCRKILKANILHAICIVAAVLSLKNIATARDLATCVFFTSSEIVFSKKDSFSPCGLWLWLETPLKSTAAGLWACHCDTGQQAWQHLRRVSPLGLHRLHRFRIRPCELPCLVSLHTSTTFDYRWLALSGRGFRLRWLLVQPM